MLTLQQRVDIFKTKKEQDLMSAPCIIQVWTAIMQIAADPLYGKDFEGFSDYLLTKDFL